MEQVAGELLNETEQQFTQLPVASPLTTLALALRRSTQSHLLKAACYSQDS
jgi:hypothetical protein